MNEAKPPYPFETMNAKETRLLLLQLSGWLPKPSAPALPRKEKVSDAANEPVSLPAPISPSKG